jgi:hypothetical protein
MYYGVLVPTNRPEPEPSARRGWWRRVWMALTRRSKQ